MGISMIIDNFLKTFDLLKEHSLTVDYTGTTNPIDNVHYPDISTDIPWQVKSEIMQKLSLLLGREIYEEILFLRKSEKGVDCPHQVHSDSVMGTYSLMLYLNEHEDGGTSFVVHKKSGISQNPEDKKYTDVIVLDQNNQDAWDILEKVEMKPNRALIFNSNRLHRAEPIGGFGSSNEDARIVLTCFFS